MYYACIIDCVLSFYYLLRNLCFIGGVDLAFTRWDDEKHSVTDEDGIK